MFDGYKSALKKWKNDLKGYINSVFEMESDYSFKRYVVLIGILSLIIVVVLLAMGVKIASGGESVVLGVILGYLGLFWVSLFLEMVYKCSYTKCVFLYRILTPLLIGVFKIVFCIMLLTGWVVVSITYALKGIYADEIGGHLFDFITGVGYSLLAILLYLVAVIKIPLLYKLLSSYQGAFLFWLFLIAIACVFFLLSMDFVFEDKKETCLNVKKEARTLAMVFCFLILFLFYTLDGNSDTYHFYQQGVNAVTLFLIWLSIKDRIENNNNKSSSTEGRICEDETIVVKEKVPNGNNH